MAKYSKAKTIKKEAPALLRAAKLAFKFIRDNPSGNDLEREELLTTLQEVIDRADPPVFDESSTTLKLVMTNPTADTILEHLEARSDLSDLDASALAAFREGLRRTKQRAYVTLDLNFVILRRLHYVLKHTNSTYQEKALERLAKTLESEALSKNPMEIIAEMGL